MRYGISNRLRSLGASGRPARVIKLDSPAVGFVLTFVYTFSVTDYVISLPWGALKISPRPGEIL